MKNHPIDRLTASASALASVNSASATTTFTGGGYGTAGNRNIGMPALIAILVGLAVHAPAATSLTTSGLIKTAGNWNNGLPSPSNPGTIAIGGTIDVGTSANALVTGFDITINTNGSLTTTGFGNNPTFDSSNININGGAINFNTGNFRGLTLQNNSVLTMSSGSVATGSNGGLLVTGGSTFTVNGGSVTTNAAARGMQVGGGGTITINSGTVTNLTGGSGTFGRGNNVNGNNVINLNGGTTTANLLTFGASSATISTTVNLGGTTAGSFTAANFNGTDAASERRINWISGSLMTMTISGADEWAAAEWTANRLFFNGQSADDLVAGAGSLSWADASNPLVGLGGGYYWNYNSGTETLSLLNAVPEPAGASLLSLGLAVAVLRRRRFVA